MASTSSPGEEPQDQNQDQQQQQQQVVVAVKEREKECLHKTKTIHFLGRTTPIVLQNDNGPCPLLAICNSFLFLLVNSFVRVFKFLLLDFLPRT